MFKNQKDQQKSNEDQSKTNCHRFAKGMEVRSIHYNHFGKQTFTAKLLRRNLG